jgi:hypothetical protein
LGLRAAKSTFAGDLPAPALDHVEGVGKTGPQLHACCGQTDTRVVALEQPGAKRLLKHPDLPAAGALCHA